MASTSASSIQKSFKYDVFLSFRGEDTRKNFLAHLYLALEQQGIITYKDDVEITKGKRISDGLIRSIEDSRFYIIVFSKNYVSSSWCLDELVKIMECQKMKEHTAYPIFYDVEPTEVRKQSGLVREASSKHKVEEEGAHKWRDALRQAADLAGWELKATLDGDEAKFIQKIVKEISLELRFINPSIDAKLVGIKTRVKDVVSCLENDIDDVRMIGIKGMGGAGKTTLAQAVFDHISFMFEGSSFVENVREVSKGSLGGLKSLQKQLLSDVLHKQDIIVKGISDFKKRLCGSKVLVVLDDVDHSNQLEALAGELNWFKPGSRIIITTRKEQVLVAHGVPKNLILDVSLLSHEEATCLFNKYAFGRVLPIQGYDMLSNQVVSYAAGLPLTIKVLGSFLRGKAELKTIPLKETLEILELSYKSLEEDYKEIFLDVACLLKGWKIKDAITALESCGFHAINGLKVLQQQSLINAHGYRRLSMHDHLEEMGKNIVRRLHLQEPSRHSRLWNQDEIEDVLVKDKGCEATRCIIIQKVDPVILMNGLQKMKELRFLGVRDNYIRDFVESHDTDSPHLPDSLQYLRWDGYPFKCLPKEFQVDNLVGLKMKFSHINQLWEGDETKVLKKLRFIDLYHCKLRSLDIGLIPNLERLSLEGCVKLVEVHIPVNNSSLRYLNLSSFGLRTLNLEPAQKLDTLKVNANYYLTELRMPDEKLKLKHLTLHRMMSKTLNITRYQNLETLYLGGDLVELHMPDEKLKLKHLALHCMMSKTLNITRYQNLETLYLKCRDLVELHMPFEAPGLKTVVVNCPKLRTLNLTGRYRNLERLVLEQFKDLLELHMPSESPNLKNVIISRSKMTSIFNRYQKLELLVLKQCEGLVEPHLLIESLKPRTIIISLSKMKTLNLTMSPNLESLELEQCEDLIELCLPIESPQLRKLNVHCSKLRTHNFTVSPNLEWLQLKQCKGPPQMLIENPNLKTIIISLSKMKTLNLTRSLDLERLELDQCKDLLELHMPIECPKLKTIDICHSYKLRTLNISGSRNLAQLYIEQCQDLIEVYMPIESYELETVKVGFSMLKTLNLSGSRNLKRLELNQCMDLAELDMAIECHKLKTISIRCSYKLRTINISGSRNLEQLYFSQCKVLVELDMPIESHALKSINIRYSKLRTLNLTGSRNLERLVLEKCEDLVELHMPIESHALKSINICFSKLRTLDLIGSRNLEWLELKQCEDLVELRMPIESPKLKTINIRCSKLRTLNLTGWYPTLERLELEQYEDLVELYMPAKSPKLKTISIRCTKLRTIHVGLSSYLDCLYLDDCITLEEINVPIGCLSGRIRFRPFVVNQGSPMVGSLAELHLTARSIGICPLHPDNNMPKLHFECIYKDYLPLWTGNLKKLITNFGICACTNLVSLSEIICGLQDVRKLTLKGSIPEVPKDLDQLECLEELHFLSTNIEHLPDSICMMKHLKLLRLESCLFFKQLPVDLGRLESLEELRITDCTSLRNIPNIICEIKRLKCLHLTNCILLEKLPMEIGRLKCLEELNIKGTGISDVPESIFQSEDLRIFL